MKQQILRYAAACFAAALLLMPLCRADLSLSARSAIVLDGTTGRVLYEKNADEKSLIASTTKIMTGLIICQQCDMGARVQIRPEAVGIEGSCMYLKAGEIFSVKELLYGLLLRSGNDAAVALAIFCAGSTEAFVARMNEKAEDLGLTATHFANPHGLDSEENYSTAKDLAILGAYAMENELFREICSTKSIQLQSRSLVNHNKLLWRYDGAVGIKTGYTKAAGRILVSAAEKNGRRLIAVTINAPNDWSDHEKLLDYGFHGFSSCLLAQKGEILATVPVLSGDKKQLDAAARESFSYPLAEGEVPLIRMHIPRFVYAPVEEGTLAGYAEFLIDGTSVARIPLFWQEDAKQVRQKRAFPILGG